MKKAAKDIKISDVIKIDIGGALFPCCKKVIGIKKEDDRVSISIEMTYGREVFDFNANDLVETVLGD